MRLSGPYARRENTLWLRCRLARAALPACPASAARDRLLAGLKRWNWELAEIEQAVGRCRLRAMPRFVILDTSVRCNLRCRACFRQHREEDLNRATPMSRPLLRRLCEQLFPAADAATPSFNGEPLLSPHLGFFVRMARRYRVKLGITTNGTLLNEQGMLDRLAPVLGGVDVSFDSATPELFERLRHPARYEEVLDNVRRVAALRARPGQAPFRLGFAVTLFEENLPELPALVRLVREAGGTSLRASCGVIFDAAAGLTAADVGSARYAQARAAAEQEGVRLGVEVSLPCADGARGGGGDWPVCRTLYSEARIDHRGVFTACLHHTPPVSASCVWRPFGRVWNSPAMCRLRAAHRGAQAPQACVSCYIRRRGGGGRASGA